MLKWIRPIFVASLLALAITTTALAQTNSAGYTQDGAYINRINGLSESTPEQAGLKSLGSGKYGIDVNAPGYTVDLRGRVIYVNPVLNEQGITPSAADLTQTGPNQYANSYSGLFHEPANPYSGGVSYWLNTQTGVYATTKAGASVGVNQKIVVVAYNQNGPITGFTLFDPFGKKPIYPDVNNYAFDANGFLGNFDPSYGLANILFNTTANVMFVSIEFFGIGYSANSLNGITAMALKILHSMYQNFAVPLIPLVVLAFIGVFLWFGVIKKDLPSVVGRGIKAGLTFLLIALLSNPSVTTTTLIQNVAAFPGAVGNFAGGLVETTVASATGQRAVGSADLINKAWVDLALNEWVIGEEGANYNAQGTAVVPLLDASSAWRNILGRPLQDGGARDNEATTLENTPDGKAAFSSTNRLGISYMAFLSNAGPVFYFLVMGLVLFLARTVFVILVAAGAVILPLELFPVTRSLTLTLRWFQYMFMTLFLVFFVSFYSSILFGLTQLIQSGVHNGVQNAVVAGLASFTFLAQGVTYLVAIWLAWVIYKKLKPMQRIKTMTDRAAARGIPLGHKQRLTVGDRFGRRGMMKKRFHPYESSFDDGNREENDAATAKADRDGGASNRTTNKGNGSRRRSSAAHDRRDASHRSFNNEPPGEEVDEPIADPRSSSVEPKDEIKDEIQYNESSEEEVSAAVLHRLDREYEEPSTGLRQIRGDTVRRLPELPGSSRAFGRDSFFEGSAVQDEEQAADSGETGHALVLLQVAKPDAEAPAQNERGYEWMKKANAAKDRAQAKKNESSTQPKPKPELRKKAKETPKQTGYDRAKRALQTLKSPDAAMDVLVDQTLGNAARWLAKTGKDGVRSIQNRRISSMPKVPKRQTTPKTKKAKVARDAPKRNYEWYWNWKTKQRAAQQTDRQTPPQAKRRAEQSAPSRSTAKPAKVWRSAGVNRLTPKKGQVQRIRTRFTRSKPERLKRPALRRKGTSLSERIFGNQR